MRSISFDARFSGDEARRRRRSSDALQEALNLPVAPRRIECFDISHIQGTDKVASMVVWEDGRMKKQDYRKFIIRTVVGNDDFASMKEVVTRRYSRLQEEGTAMPGLVLIDGGLGQLHAAAEALDAIGIINQPLASIAKREEIIYVLGQENEPVVLDRFSPILHLIQSVRDEAHRFAVTFHQDAEECFASDVGARRESGCGEDYRDEAAEAFREFGAGAGGVGGRTGGAGGKVGGAQGEGSIMRGVVRRTNSMSAHGRRASPVLRQAQAKA